MGIGCDENEIDSEFFTDFINENDEFNDDDYVSNEAEDLDSP